MVNLELNFIILFKVWLVASQVANECPIGWVEYARSRCFYFHFYPPRNYIEATVGCQVDGAYVLSINTREEFDFISDWLTKNDQNRKNQWWTSGVGRGDNMRWEGDGTRVLSIPDYWHFEGDYNSIEKGNNLVYSYSTISSQFKWDRTRQTEQLSYICEISIDEAYRIIQQDRDHMFGTNVTNPNDVMYGPKIIVQPQTIVVVGDISEVHVECVAMSNPQPKYEWYKKSRTGELTLVETNSYYTITNGKLLISRPVGNRDEGVYQCIATNILGSVISNPVEINFGYLQEFSNDPPGSVTALMYKGTVLSCKPPLYNPAIHIRWYKEDGGPNFLRTDLHPHQFVSLNGKAYLSETSNSDAGFYHCFVALVAPVGQEMASEQWQSRTSLGIKLVITGDSPSNYGPEIHNDFPAVFPVPSLRGNLLTIECFAYGKLPLHYSWKKDNGPLPNKAVLSEHGRVITLPDAQLEDAGNYTCRVERGSSGMAEKSMNLVIQAKPFFIFPLKDQHIDINSPLTWRCEAIGVPAPVYTWYKNGKIIGNVEVETEVRTNILTIHSADPIKHNGMYQCEAKNTHGSTFSSAQIRVLAFKPSFERRPLNPSQTATEGGSVTIRCQPEAAPQPTLSWMKDGVALSLSGDIDAKLVQLPNGNLQINELQKSDEGIYQCTATNNFGSASSSGKLRIVAKTTMIVTPISTRVDVNATAFLGCQASYDSKQKDLVYVWDIFGRQINYAIEPHYMQGDRGSVPGLYITNAQVYHTGKYGCTAISVDDSIRVTATLTVYGPPGESGGVIAAISGRNATVKWVIGPNNNADITKFHIEFSTNFNHTWRVIKNDITLVEAIDHNRVGRCLYDVHDLKPGSSYRFRVVAYNRYGRGPPSLPSSYYKIPDAAPAIPVNKISESWGPVGTLAIEWEPLSEEDLTGDNVGYTVYYRKKSNTDTKWSVEDVPGRETKFSALIGPENYYLEYEIKIGAFNSMGRGPNSTVQIIMSQPDMPLGAATNVHVESYNATCLRVIWTPIPEIREYVRGKVVGYGINYWIPGKDMESSNMYCDDQENGDCGSVLLVGLDPFSYYWVNVQVFTSAGMGTLSEDDYGQTFRSPPKLYPEYVHIRSHTGNAVFVTWKGVSSQADEEPIIGYKLRWWPSTENIRSANITVIGERHTFGPIHGVSRGIVYSLRVMGYSLGGDGVNSPTVYFTLEGQVIYNPETTEILNFSNIKTGNTFLIFTIIALYKYCLGL